MKPSLHNRQAKLRLHLQAIRKLLNWMLAQTASLRKLQSWNEIALIFVDDDGILPVNIVTFDKDEPTDVISLTYREMPGAPARRSGEIFVNAERAKEVGRSPAGTRRELALYIAHGLHHLAGASDRTPALRRAMLREETAWVRQAEKAGLLKGLA